MISFDIANSYLKYDPLTGHITWRCDRKGKVKAGDIAGTSKGRRYVDIKICNKNYRAHVLAWLLYTGIYPDHEVDHKNSNGLDNKWLNLRAATHMQNTWNKAIQKNSSTGFKGVCFRKDIGKFQSRIMVRGKSINLGFYLSAEEAHAAYCMAANDNFGEFARHG